MVYTRDPKDSTDECLVHPLAKRIVRGEFKDVFPDEVPSGLPPIRVHDHRILVEEGAKPQFRPTYRLSEKEKEEAQNKIREWIAKGWIRPSSSPWGAPIPLRCEEGWQAEVLCGLPVAEPSYSQGPVPTSSGG